MIWLDIEHTVGKRYMTWDRHLFPDPEGMQKDLASRGRKTVTIVDPHLKADMGYSVYAEAKNLGYFVKDKDGRDFEGHCWPGGSSWLDYLNPQVYVCVCKCICVYLCVVEYWNAHICMCLNIYVCMYACVYVSTRSCRLLALSVSEYRTYVQRLMHVSIAPVARCRARVAAYYGVLQNLRLSSVITSSYVSESAGKLVFRLIDFPVRNMAFGKKML